MDVLHAWLEVRLTLGVLTHCNWIKHGTPTSQAGQKEVFAAEGSLA
jgi:hypothetical protein